MHRIRNWSLGILALGMLFGSTAEPVSAQLTSFSIEDIGVPIRDFGCGGGFYINDGRFFGMAAFWLVFLAIFWPRRSLLKNAASQRKLYTYSGVVIFLLAVVSAGLALMAYQQNSGNPYASLLPGGSPIAASAQSNSGLEAAGEQIGLGCADLAGTAYNILGLIIIPPYLASVIILLILRLRASPKPSTNPSEAHIFGPLMWLILMSVATLVAHAYVLHLPRL